MKTPRKNRPSRETVPVQARIEAGALLKLPVVLALVPYSKTTLYAKIKLGEFPKPVKLGLRAVAWPSAVIQEFIAGLELGR